MSVTTLIVIVLILLLIGGLPNWGFHQVGWAPSGTIGIVLVVVILLVLLKVF